MSSETGSVPHDDGGTVTIPFRTQNGRKDEFLALFREGMALVEQAAAYLDGQGRRESKCLTPYVTLAYATESMRLTTRLTQLATWLLARRAVMNGEPMPPTGSANDPLVLPPMTRMTGSRGYEELPGRLKELIEEAHRLHAKICDFDAAERGLARPAARKFNPVAAQVAQIQAAFRR
jgi:regulator of CtrA degradation